MPDILKILSKDAYQPEYQFYYIFLNVHILQLCLKAKFNSHPFFFSANKFAYFALFPFTLMRQLTLSKSLKLSKSLYRFHC